MAFEAIWNMDVMKINLQRNIDRFAGTILCRILSFLSIKKSHNQHKPQKIMIILLSEMGSLVLAHPMFEKLKKKYPEAEIYGLLFEQNSIILEIIEVIPLENIITVSNKSILRLVWASLLALYRMRLHKIDTIIDCELFSRISSVFSFLSGAEIRVGFHRHKQEGLYRGDFINRPVLYNPYYHISEQFITLVQAIESDGMPLVKQYKNTEPFFPPAVTFSVEEVRLLQKKLYDDFPKIANLKLILLYPGGGLLPIRAWPLERYSQLAGEFIKKGYAVGIIGMASDKPLARKIQSDCNDEPCIDLTGYTQTVRELMIIFHFASLLITNDGGPGHFATMTPLPSIIFYGPETPVLYGPLGSNSYIFHKELSCSPCLTAYNHRNSPCDGNNRCLQEIQVAEVLQKAEEILSA